MKKAILLFATMAATVALNTVAKTDKQDSDEQQTRQKFLEAKVEHMTKKLQLSDEQKTQFVPLYKEYNQAMREVMPAMNERQEPTDDVKTEANRIKQRLEGHKKAIDVQIKYVDRFANVLTAKQLHQFLKIERTIHNKVGKHRNDGQRGKGFGKGKGQGRHFRNGPKPGQRHQRHQRPRPQTDTDTDFTE